jgi:hypothetical protein
MSASPTFTGTVGAASITSSALTSGRVLLAGSSGLITDNSNLLFDGTQLYNSASQTGNSGFRNGSQEFQSFAVNNNFLSDNLYYNGGFIRRASGFGGLFYFYLGEGQFRFANSGSGSATLVLPFKANYNGDVAIGGNINATPTVYTDATAVFSTTKANIADPLYIGDLTTTPTAKLHIAAGTATANTAPLKFTSGTNLTTAEAGAIEYDATELYATNSTAVRGNVIVVRLNSSSAGTLTLATTYTHYVFTGTTTTWTLPAVSGTTSHIFYIKNRGSGAITLNAAAAANEIYTTSAVNTVTINAGESYMLLSDGTYWLVE